MRANQCVGGEICGDEYGGGGGGAWGSWAVSSKCRAERRYMRPLRAYRGRRYEQNEPLVRANRWVGGEICGGQQGGSG